MLNNDSSGKKVCAARPYCALNKTALLAPLALFLLLSLTACGSASYNAAQDYAYTDEPFEAAAEDYWDDGDYAAEEV